MTDTASATHTRITSDQLEVIASIPSCRAGFASSETLVPGKPYRCMGPAIQCARTYHLTDVALSQGDGDRIEKYVCTGGSQADVPLTCSSRWEMYNQPQPGPQGYVTRYVCNRKLEDDRKSRCSEGWNPGAEDYEHGFRPDDWTTNPDFDLQPTHAFYGCAPNPRWHWRRP